MGYNGLFSLMKKVLRYHAEKNGRVGLDSRLRGNDEGWVGGGVLGGLLVD